MTVLLLSAGEATRLGDLAPGGCKAAARVNDRQMIDWTWEALGRPTVVCRSKHLGAISKAIDTVVVDEGGGPAFALDRALQKVQPTGPVTVVYADTWVPEWGVPTDPEFCGVAAARGGRKWDVVEDGLVAYRHVAEGEAALVCIGLYRFADPQHLAVAVKDALVNAPSGEVGMGDVVNTYGLPFAPVLGWQDVGDLLAVSRWRPL